jgi:hypothetical protein
MLALLIIVAVILVLFVAYWFTLRDQASRELEPTLLEHAAADAGRTSPAGTVGAHDALSTGPPAYLEDAMLRDRDGPDVR